MTAALYVRKSADQSGVSDEQKSVARQIEHAKALDEHIATRHPKPEDVHDLARALTTVTR